MDSYTANSTNAAVRNFQVGDRVRVTVHPIFAGRTREITNNRILATGLKLIL